MRLSIRCHLSSAFPFALALSAACGLALAKGAASAERLTELRADIAAAQFDTAKVVALAELREVDRAQEPELFADLADIATEASWRSHSVDPGSIELAKQAVLIREPLEGSNPEALAYSLHLLGNVHKELARVDAAADAWTKSLQVRRTHGLASTEKAAATMNNLGAALLDEGQLPKAMELLHESLTIKEAYFGKESQKLVGTLSSLSDAYDRIRQSERAEDLARRVLAIRRKYEGSDTPGVALAETNLAAVLINAGRPLDARPLLEQATSVLRRLGDQQLPARALALAHYALVLASLGFVVAAGEIAEEARVLLVTSELGGSLEGVQALSTLGCALQMIGRTSHAREILSQAVTLLRPQASSNPPLFLRCLNNLVIAERSEGSARIARATAHEALQVAAQLGESRSEIVARIKTNLALTESDLGNRSAAIRLLEEALALRKDLGVLSTPGGRYNRATLALLLTYQRRYGQALDLARELHQDELVEMRRVIESSSERESATRISSLSSGLSVRLLTLSQGLDSPQLARETFEAIVSTRGLIARFTRLRNQCIHSPDSDRDRAGLEQWRRLASSFTALAYHRPQDSGIRERLHQESVELDRMERELAAPCLATLEDWGRHYSVEDVRRTLPPNSALISFVAYYKYHGDRAAKGSRKVGRSPRESEYAAFVLRADSSVPEYVRFRVTATEIDTAVADWSKAVLAESSAVGARSAGRTLARLVWDPLLPHLNGVTSAHIVADGVLHFVDFNSLVGASGKFLIETSPRLMRIDTETALFVQRRFPASDARVIAVGASDPPLVDTWSGVDKPRPPLHGAAAEVAEITRIWRGPLEGATGPRASEDFVRTRSSSASILHLATHVISSFSGEPQDAPPLVTAIVADAVNDSLDRPRPPVGWSMMQGMLLTGFDPMASVPPIKERPEVDNDGILSALEISTLDLSHVDLAVVAGCEGGVGMVRGFEGPLGLRRAFLAAGVPHLVVAMWPVPDDFALEWMSQFYRSLGTGEGPSLAAHHASLNRLAARRRANLPDHPITWAGFVSFGRDDEFGSDREQP